MNEPILNVSGLCKRFGDFVAVNDISFSIAKGEIVGLLGPNGAGKSTTIQMLLALTKPSSGKIEYFGKDLNHHREHILERINYVSAYSEMQTRVTVWENLEVFAMLYGVKDWQKKVLVLSEALGIEQKLKSLFWFLSSGEKARVNLVKAFLNDPEIILMDEPTASLDPEIVHTVLRLIADMKKRQSVTILYTSHNMGEVTRICDKVMFLYHGSVIATDTPLGLSRRVADATLRLTYDGEITPVVSYVKKHKYDFSTMHQHVISISLDEKDIPKVLFGLGKTGVFITDIEIEKPNLEDVFLAVAKGGAHAFDES